MLSSPLVPRTAVLCSVVFQVYSQNVPGAGRLQVGGAPRAGPSQLVDNYPPAGMLGKFSFFDKVTPGNGHVQYVNESVATHNEYAILGGQGGFVLKPETNIAIPEGGPATPSVRIVSDNTYYHGMLIIHLNHIPTGCACDSDAHFQNMSIALNIEFCGDPAGNIYSQYDMCPQCNNASLSSSTRCVNYVGSNPSALSEAYFDINSLRMYQMPTDVAPVLMYSTSLPSVTPAATSNLIPLGMGAATSTLSSLAYSGPISSSASSSAISQPTTGGSLVFPANPCPSQGAQTTNVPYTDSGGAPYEIYCGGDGEWISTDTGTLGAAQSFESCMSQCDAQPGCAAVLYNGANDSGLCYPEPAGAFQA
ncbi:glycoside hydrolase family 16 protein [Dothistroma septosporum NZE10]|uniref:Glycoside hydrolase family 16 protein n=1 Tax=Dothistroma septosporum (strain NZE10 / CBS 128990) TaxID=675120 RepID=N1PPB6_DOTSN|nr:glycoside hydrolase family 16 protein [Dothistroma septosporum NZE10]